MIATQMWMDEWQNGVEALLEGRLDDAISQLSEFVRVYPDSFEGCNFLGVALSQAGWHQEAIAHLRRAVEREPRNARARCNFGLALMGAGDCGLARRQLEEALLLDPSQHEAIEALSRLKPETAPMTAMMFLQSMTAHSSRDTLQGSNLWQRLHAEAETVN